MVYIPNFHTLESMNGIEKEEHNPMEELVQRQAKIIISFVSIWFI